MHLDGLIGDLALILIVAAAITIIFRKLKQPLVLGYIVAGFLISPNFVYLPTVVDSADITVWGDIGVIFLMFGLGLEFSFKKILNVGGSAFTIAATVMVCMILTGTGVGYLLGLGKMNCIFLGGMISMSSTMIILKAYEEYKLKEENFAQLVLGALVIEDIAGVFMLIVLSTISVGQNISGLELIGRIGIMVIYLVIWLVLGIFIIPTVLKKVSKYINDETLLITSIGLCLSMVVLANLMGFSSALGAFITGSILAGTVNAERIEHMFLPIKNLFGAIFFVSVGMMIQPELMIKYAVPIVIISLVVIIGQMLFSFIGILLSGHSLHSAVCGSCSMVQIGEFSFIVATLGLSLGVLSDYLYPIIICVSVLTSFVTPVFIKNSERIYGIVDKKMPRKIKTLIRKNTSENQNRKSIDPDWNAYIQKMAIRTGICSAIMFIIYFSGTRYLPVFVDYFAGDGLVVRAINAAIILILMIPFINLMHGTNNVLQVKLWIKYRSNRFPIITLKAIRVLIAACFVALVIRRFFHIPFVVLVALSAFPIVMIIRSDWINGVTIGMEKRFAANISERILEKEKRERNLNSDYNWLDKSLYVCEFQVTAENFEKTIYDITNRRDFIVIIIRIIRGTDYINNPAAGDIVKSGDVLQMIGTKDEIDACMMLLERSNATEPTGKKVVSLKDFTYGQRFKGLEEESELLYVPVVVKSNSSLVRKSIRNSDLRMNYKANLIGIERGNLTMVSPDIDTKINKGDILWLIGDYRMMDRLIRRGLLDN